MRRWLFAISSASGIAGIGYGGWLHSPLIIVFGICAYLFNGVALALEMKREA